jgi:hypothetical protein
MEVGAGKDTHISRAKVKLNLRVCCETTDISKVRNVSVKCVYYVTECTIRSFFYSQDGLCLLSGTHRIFKYTSGCLLNLRKPQIEKV